MALTDPAQFRALKIAFPKCSEILRGLEYKQVKCYITLYIHLVLHEVGSRTHSNYSTPKWSQNGVKMESKQPGPRSVCALLNSTDVIVTPNMTTTDKELA